MGTNKDLVRRLYSELHPGGNTSEAREILADSYVDHDIPGLGEGGREELIGAVLASERQSRTSRRSSARYWLRGGPGRRTGGGVRLPHGSSFSAQDTGLWRQDHVERAACLPLCGRPDRRALGSVRHAWDPAAAGGDPRPGLTTITDGRR